MVISVVIRAVGLCMVTRGQCCHLVSVNRITAEKVFHLGGNLNNTMIINQCYLSLWWWHAYSFRAVFKILNILLLLYLLKRIYSYCICNMHKTLKKMHSDGWKIFYNKYQHIKSVLSFSMYLKYMCTKRRLLSLSVYLII